MIQVFAALWSLIAIAGFALDGHPGIGLAAGSAILTFLYGVDRVCDALAERR